MSARDEILARVREAELAPVDLPDVHAATKRFQRSAEPPAVRMERVSTSNGAKVVNTTPTEIGRVVQSLFPDARKIVSTMDAVAGNAVLVNDPHAQSDVDVFICRGALGVSEDGNVWVPAPRTGHRAALFLAAHVVLVLDRTAIVDTFHEAYASIDVTAQAFGVFISGPSKTADIEQSLVVGAHGPKALTLLLVGDEAVGQQAIGERSPFGG